MPLYTLLSIISLWWYLSIPNTISIATYQSIPLYQCEALYMLCDSPAAPLPEAFTPQVFYHSEVYLLSCGTLSWLKRQNLTTLSFSICIFSNYHLRYSVQLSNPAHPSLSSYRAKTSKPISTVQHPEAEDLVLLPRLLCRTMQLLQDRAPVPGPRCQLVHNDVLAGPRGGVPARNREVDGPPTTSSRVRKPTDKGRQKHR